MPILPSKPSGGNRSKNTFNRPLYVARYTGVPATTMRARAAAASAAATVGAEPRPSSASAGSAARSTGLAGAPPPRARARAYATSTRDLDLAAGLADGQTTGSVFFTLLTA